MSQGLLPALPHVEVQGWGCVLWEKSPGSRWWGDAWWGRGVWFTGCDYGQRSADLACTSLAPSAGGPQELSIEDT